MAQDRTKDWREICKAAASEADPEKLIYLIRELTRALDERDERRQKISEENVIDRIGRPVRDLPGVRPPFGGPA